MSSFGGKKATVKLGYFSQIAIGGTAAVIGHSLVHPIDVMKIRMQVVKDRAAAGIWKTMSRVVQEDGLMAFTRGLSACATRHIVYSSIRVGAYPIVRGWFQGDSEQPPSLMKKIAASATTGAVGSFIANPNDVILVRMQAGKFGYRNVFDGFWRAARDDGILSLWRGCAPTVIRATVLNVGQLASYDQLKQMLLTKTSYFKDDLLTHFVASTTAGIIAITISNPVDVIKTRMMNMKPDAKGVMPYRGVVDCVKKVARNEGFRGFYKGLLPASSRTIPVTVLMFILYEKVYAAYLYAFHNKAYKEMKASGGLKKKPGGGH